MKEKDLKIIDYTLVILDACHSYFAHDNYCLVNKFPEVQLYYILNKETWELYSFRKNKNNIIIWNEGKICDEMIDYYKKQL